MTTTFDQQQTWTHTEAGTGLVGDVCASAPAVVHDDAQDGGSSLHCSSLNWRGLCPPHLSIFHHERDSSPSSRRRPAGSIPHLSAAALIRCGGHRVDRVSRSPVQFHGAHHVACKLSDAAPVVGHSWLPSSEVNQPRNRSRNLGKVSQQGARHE